MSIDINWPSWSGDNRIEIFDPSNNLVATYCDPARCFTGTNGNYSTTVSLGCLPVANNYRVVLSDSFGDGWNGGGNIVINIGTANSYVFALGTGNSSTESFNVTGSNLSCNTPDISITANNIEIADGATGTSTANNTDFGTAEGPERIYQRFTINNLGGQELIMSGSNPVTFIGTGGAYYDVVEQPTGIIPGGGSISFFAYVSRPTPGTSSATCTISSNDPDEPSYTFEITSTSTARKSAFFYENFDSGANGWTSNGTNLNWTLGTTFENGEGLYFYTDNFNNYPRNARATLESPTISTLGYTDIEFQLDFRTNTNDANDGMRVEYSANNGITWNILGAQNSGVNWYNGNNVDALSNNSHGW
ncbi:hypothetical protein JCM19297_1762 [Nonlabens ulvanivorans]|nr:hypothetical protein [Nonlabens ulvanivorans]GAK90446.1 hypothetical protein JCM19297_1762 [Nonlabens ulvanivorans]